MEYFILTDTEFFRQINKNEDDSKLAIAYHDFIKAIFDLYLAGTNRYELFFVMTYTETELQSLCECRRSNSDKNSESNSCLLYIRKALSLVRRTLTYIQNRVIPLYVSSATNQASSLSSYRWTGSTVELVELIYGLIEMHSINNGETPVIELTSFISSQLGIEIKDCYSAYMDMKHRKNDSRTYFLDKMRERLNRRIQLDDERERMRK